MRIFNSCNEKFGRKILTENFVLTLNCLRCDRFQVVINSSNVSGTIIGSKWTDVEQRLQPLGYEQREFRDASELERFFLAYDLQAPEECSRRFLGQNV